MNKYYMALGICLLANTMITLSSESRKRNEFDLGNALRKPNSPVDQKVIPKPNPPAYQEAVSKPNPRSDQESMRPSRRQAYASDSRRQAYVPENAHVSDCYEPFIARNSADRKNPELRMEGRRGNFLEQPNAACLVAALIHGGVAVPSDSKASGGAEQK
jgi:hypothetical protein